MTGTPELKIATGSFTHAWGDRTVGLVIASFRSPEGISPWRNHADTAGWQEGGFAHGRDGRLTAAAAEQDAAQSCCACPSLRLK